MGKKPKLQRWQWITLIAYLSIFSIIVVTLFVLLSGEPLSTPKAVQNQPKLALAMSATPTKRPTFTPTATPKVPPTDTPTRIPTRTPTVTASWTPLPTRTALPSATPTKMPTATFTPQLNATAVDTLGQPRTITSLDGGTPLANIVSILEATSASTATASPTPKPTRTPTATASPTPKPTRTPTATASPTPKPTRTPTATASPTPKPTRTPTATASPTPKPTRTPTATASPTPKPTRTPTATASPTPKPTRTPTATVAALQSANVAGQVLLDGNIELNWDENQSAENSDYRIYSDMGSGYGVHIFQGYSTQPQFIAPIERMGMTYSYRVESLMDGEHRWLGETNIQTKPAPIAAKANVIPSASGVSAQAGITVIPAPTPLPRDALLLGLVSDASYVDDLGTLTVVGEIRNDSNLDVGDVSVTLSFYNAAGTLIADVSGAAMLKTLSPNDRAPFRISLPRPAGMNNYSIKAVGRPVNGHLSPQIEIVSTEAFEDQTGFYHVKGVIKNTGSVSIPRAKAIATLYGRGGGVVNVGFDYPDPSRLSPSETATFDIVFTYFPKVLTHQLVFVGD